MERNNTTNISVFEEEKATTSEYFDLQGKKIFIVYKNYKIGFPEDKDNIENNLILKFDQNNKVSIFYPDYVEITVYTVDNINKKIFFLNWNEERSGLFVSMFQNIKNREVNFIRFNIITKEIIISNGKFVILDENIFSEKNLVSINQTTIPENVQQISEKSERSSRKNKEEVYSTNSLPITVQSKISKDITTVSESTPSRITSPIETNNNILPLNLNIIKKNNRRTKEVIVDENLENNELTKN